MQAHKLPHLLFGNGSWRSKANGLVENRQTRGLIRYFSRDYSWNHWLFSRDYLELIFKYLRRTLATNCHHNWLIFALCCVMGNLIRRHSSFNSKASRSWSSNFLCTVCSHDRRCNRPYYLFFNCDCDPKRDASLNQQFLPESLWNSQLFLNRNFETGRRNWRRDC